MWWKSLWVVSLLYQILGMVFIMPLIKICLWEKTQDEILDLDPGSPLQTDSEIVEIVSSAPWKKAKDKASDLILSYTNKQ